MQPDVADLADRRRGWWRRARGSVRLRVTVIAAGVFAVTLLIAAFALLRALEGALVDDVRAADRAALMTQARAVMVNGLPADVLRIEGATGSAVDLPYPGTRRVVAFRTLLAYLLGSLQLAHFGSLAGAGTRRLAELPDDQFPVLAETARHAQRVDPEAEFRQGLAVILRGLESDA